MATTTGGSVSTKGGYTKLATSFDAGDDAAIGRGMELSSRVGNARDARAEDANDDDEEDDSKRSAIFIASNNFGKRVQQYAGYYVNANERRRAGILTFAVFVAAIVFMFIVVIGFSLFPKTEVPKPLYTYAPTPEIPPYLRTKSPTRPPR